ncbi:MAG: branched-chain amino acid ABC transporter permease [Proteobacteria bacterium]|nr:branched-chain amino acid ABC transporter permease [Pseudomonadota bacterium]
MNLEIALLLAQDGIANGAIYVLVALGTVLIFTVTRVIFVPFGDIAAYAALTLASFQLERTPGTIWLVMTLAGLALAMEVYTLLRRGEAHRLPMALLHYAVLPLIPIAAVWIVGGQRLPMAAEIALALALVMPIAPLLYRIAFRPLADAPVLVLLIVALAVHFAISGLALLFFGPEGFRTEPLTRAMFTIGTIVITGQSLLIVGASIVFGLLLFLFFGRTMAGKALRATAINRTGARLVGIRPAAAGELAFLLASVLAGTSGILIGPVATLYYDSGFILGLKAFVGAIIGGLVSYPVAALGAVFVGLLESYASFWNSSLKEVVVFASLIPVLLWRSLTFAHLEDEDEAEDAA